MEIKNAKSDAENLTLKSAFAKIFTCKFCKNGSNTDWEMNFK